VAVDPEVRLPMVQVTVPEALVQPGEADTKLPTVYCWNYSFLSTRLWEVDQVPEGGGGPQTGLPGHRSTPAAALRAGDIPGRTAARRQPPRLIDTYGGSAGSWLVEVNHGKVWDGPSL
jgi:hypothetical protein